MSDLGWKQSGSIKISEQRTTDTNYIRKSFYCDMYDKTLYINITSKLDVLKRLS